MMKASRSTYKLLLVAFSICSSRAVLAEEDHQDIILKTSRRAVGRGVAEEVEEGAAGGWSRSKRRCKIKMCGAKCDVEDEAGLDGERQ